MKSDASIEQHFAGKSPNVRAVYNRLVATVGKFGECTEDPKKTSIHLNRRTAFAGVATRKETLILTIKASREIASSRIFKSEQVSVNRWHHEVKLAKPSEIDRELTSWLKEAYELSA